MSQTVPYVAVPVNFPMELETEGGCVFQNKEVITINPKSKIPRPQNAFMIFANEWRKIFATQYPSESNKNISIRLGQKWKSLDNATKEMYFQAARRADVEHKLKFPDYVYNPKEARLRKALLKKCCGSKRGRKPKSQCNQPLAFLVPQNVFKNTNEIPINAETFRELNNSQSADEDKNRERLSEQYLVIDERNSLSPMLAKVSQQNGSRVILAPNLDASRLFQTPIESPIGIYPKQNTNVTKLTPQVIQKLHNNLEKFESLPEIPNINKNETQNISQNMIRVKDPRVMNSSQKFQLMPILNFPTRDNNNRLSTSRYTILSMNDVIVYSNIQPKTEVSNNVSQSEDGNDPLNASLPELNPYGLTQQMLSTTPCMTSLISEDFGNKYSSNYARDTKYSYKNNFLFRNESLALSSSRTVNNELFQNDSFTPRDAKIKFTKGVDKSKIKDNITNVGRTSTPKTKYESFLFAESSPLDLSTNMSFRSPQPSERNKKFCLSTEDEYHSTENKEIVLDLSTKTRDITERSYEINDKCLSDIENRKSNEQGESEISSEEDDNIYEMNNLANGGDNSITEYKSLETEHEHSTSPEKKNVFDELFNKMSEDLMPLNLSLNSSENRQEVTENSKNSKDENQKVKDCKLNESQKIFQGTNFKKSASLNVKSLDDMLIEGKTKLQFPRGTPNILKRNVRQKQSEYRTESEEKRLFEKFSLSSKMENSVGTLKNGPIKNKEVEIFLLQDIVKREGVKNNKSVSDKEQEDSSFKITVESLQSHENLKVESPLGGH